MSYIKLIELNEELIITIDGYNGQGIISKYSKDINEQMNEELSTGI